MRLKTICILIKNKFQTISLKIKQARKTINAFKDSYKLDFLNVEEIDARDKRELDEKAIEQLEKLLDSTEEDG